MRHPRLPLLLVVLFTASASADEPDGRSIYRRTLHGTAWVTSANNRGSGWLLDRDARLLVTNFHVVGDEETVDVVFPASRDGKVVAERTWYRDNRDALRKSGLMVAGKVVARDADRDLALVELKSVPETATPLTLAAESAEPGDRVHSVGNRGDLEALWVYASGVVRQVYRTVEGYRWQTKQLAKGAKLVVTQSPINDGDSGGPVVNDGGEVVAVAAAVRWQGTLTSVGIDVSEVRALLAKARPDVKLRGGAKRVGGTGRDVAAELRRATGWVRTATSNRRTTAWVLSVPRRLAVSSCHAVGPRDVLTVAFPAREVGGCVLVRDERRDLALIELDAVPADVAELKLSDEGASPGQRVHTIGHPNGAECLGLYGRGVVRQLWRTRLIREQQKDGNEPLAVALELPPAEEDSGGPVVDDRGRVVAGLSDREAPQQLVRYAADVAEVRAFLAESKGWHDSQTAAEHRRRAALLARARRLDRALGELDAALQREPRYAPTFCERCRVHLMRGDAAKAAEDCEQALRLDSRAAVGHVRKAEVLLARGQRDAALAAAETAVGLDAKCAAAFVVRGRIRRLLGEFDHAREDDDEAVRLDPNSADAYFERGLTHAARKYEERAVADFTRAIEFDPLRADAYRHRGDAYRRLNQAKAAAADHAQATELSVPQPRP